MKKVNFNIFYFFLFAFWPALLGAQSPFKAGVLLGINYAQIDGDYQYGYDKRGVSFGLRGTTIFKKNFEIATELLYNQRGTLPKTDISNKYNRRIYMDLRYAEVPIWGNLKLGSSEEGFYRWGIQFGVSYGRLLRSTTQVYKTTNQFDSVYTVKLGQDRLRSGDIGAIFGISYYITHRWSLNVRHTMSLRPLYSNEEDRPRTSAQSLSRPVFSLRSYFLSIHTCYDFIAPKLKRPKKRKAA